jgi:F0F1-type ATP synthase assembly protein I
MGVATTFASEVAGGVLLGWAIDWMLDTRMTWIIVGAITGLVVGMVNFIRGAIKETNAAAKDVQRIKKP